MWGGGGGVQANTSGSATDWFYFINNTDFIMRMKNSVDPDQLASSGASSSGSSLISMRVYNYDKVMCLLD